MPTFTDTLAHKRFPTVYSALSAAAKPAGLPPMTPADFQRITGHWPSDRLKQLENVLWAMTPEQRAKRVGGVAQAFLAGERA